MKIYKHSYDSYKKEVITIEVEAEEKPKTYIITESKNGVWESRVTKDEIGRLVGKYDRRMFTLTPDRKYYINALIENKELIINHLKTSLENAVAEKTLFLKLLEQEGGVE